MSSWTLEGKCALVTGGTKGIGWAIAEEFLLLGAEVFIVARNAEDVEMRLAEWKRRDLPAYGLRADVTVEADRAAMIAAVEQRWGRLDVLVRVRGYGGESSQESEGRETRQSPQMTATERKMELPVEGQC